MLRRRSLLAGTAILATGLVRMSLSARAETIQGALPWHPYAGDPPEPVRPGPWHFFTPEEGAAVEALVDRLIPPDPETPGGKDAGCAVFIDRQLAGPYGTSASNDMRPPFLHGTKEQGMQSPLTPAPRYRQGLAALDAQCRAAYAGKVFRDLTPELQDQVITGLQNGSLHLDGSNGRAFFDQVLKDTQQGFLADPVYGGNRDMVAWRMIGFPGARYDYRDWIDRHNEAYPRPPLSIAGRPAWSAPR